VKQMAAKVKQEKNETQNQWNYQQVSRKMDKKVIGYYNGHAFTY